MGNKGLVKVYVIMFFAILFWGFSFIWTKEALRVYRPITVIFFRLVLSVVLLFVLGKMFSLLEIPRREDWKRFVLVAFWEPFAYFLGENFGLTHVTSTTAAVIIATIPLFSPVASYYVNGERISGKNVIGILISIVGVGLVVMKDNFSLKGDWIGIGLMFWAVFSAVFYSVFVLDLSKRYSVYTIISFQNLIGAVMFLPLFLIFDFKQVLSVGFRWEAIYPIINLSVFASTLAFMAFTYGIKHLGVTKANVLSNLIPIFTAIFSYFILGERFTWFNILGILLVVSGVILGQSGTKEEVVVEY